MKNYVVGYLSFFENDIVLLKVQAESKYDAAKKAILEICSEEYKQDEIDWQNHEDYPKTFEALQDYMANADSVVDVIEI